MNPYILINRPVSAFTYNYAKGILQTIWPECEPVSATFPDIKVRLIPVGYLQDIYAECTIKVWLNGELAPFELTGSKIFRLESRGKELNWDVNHQPDSPLLVDKMEDIILDEFLSWQPHSPNVAGFIDVIFNNSSANTLNFEPYSDLFKISLGYAAYEGKLLFASPNKLWTNPDPSQLAKQIYELWRGKYLKQTGLEPLGEAVAAPRRDNYMRMFAEKIATIYGVFKEAGAI